ncbi:MAG: LysM peptidoglycan-binding domain-containing protein [Thiohalocapsa sp.]
MKVAAVLGIALITVLLVAAILYGLLGVQLSEDEGSVIRQATTGVPSNAVESDTLATSEPSSQPQSRIPELERSMSVSESLIALPDPPTSELDPSISTPNPSKESISEADVSPKLSAGSAAKATHLSSTPPKMSSDEATSETSLPSQKVSEPADTLYYTVKEGDTLYSIARRIYGESGYWKVIYDANRNLIKDPVKLKLTWKLELPPLEKVSPEN